MGVVSRITCWHGIQSTNQAGKGMDEQDERRHFVGRYGWEENSGERQQQKRRTRCSS